jgi:hypothetical protein
MTKNSSQKHRMCSQAALTLCFLTNDLVADVRERLLAAGVEMVDLGGEKIDDGICL